MKFSFTMLAIVCTVCALAKNDTSKTSASQQHATVYLGYGAERRHSAKISVNKTTRFIVIDKISTQIHPNTSLDTLDLSPGKDSDIIQTFTYVITVRNNKSGRINLVLKDQYPLSKLQDVEVKVLNKGDADAENEEVGSLTWQLNLKPGESRTIKFSYQVKYPKDKKISNF